MKLTVWAVLLLSACGGAKSTSGPVTAPTPAGDITQVPPELVPNAANLYMRCDIQDGQRADPCDAIPHNLDVVGNRVENCYRRPNGGFKFELKSTGDATDTVVVSIDNYNGPNTYNLDDPYARFIKVSGSEMVATCASDGRGATGPAQRFDIVAQSPGPDRSCDSRGCTLQIAAADPAKPDRFQITVKCPELCESNSFLVCKQRSGAGIEFSFAADCAVE